VTTREVVQRVLPLLEHLSSRTLEKARLLQYLAARASADWGTMSYVGEERENGDRTLVFRDRISRELRRVRYPECLPPAVEDDVLAEYKRLALNTPLSTMEPRLFHYLYAAGYCSGCRYDLPETRQVCRECHFAGRPVNFEPR